MGNLCESAEVKLQTQISKTIDKELNKPATKIIQKLLLLGPGESGKSTFVKQMQILHMNGFNEDEREQRKALVYSNTVRSMMDILNAMPVLGISVSNRQLEYDVAVLGQHVDDGLEFGPFPLEVENALKRLWQDPGVLAAFDQRSNYQLNDSAQYFLHDLDRICKENYRPTDQDILRTRVATTGIVKITFEIRGIDFNVFDVSGQRSQRRKWIHIFDDVNAIIFVAAISEYDQSLREDNRTNRLMDALMLFDNIANNKFFVKSSMILFLNKTDLFAEKIKKVSLDVLFPSYRGHRDYKDGISYIKFEFSKMFRNSKQQLYIHETCATDTDQVDNVFKSVFDMIIKKNLKGKFSG